MADSMPRAMVDKFRAMALERVERANNALLALESAPRDAQSLDVLMRELHTLKGEARMMGFEPASRLAHKSEDLVIRARDRGFRDCRDLVDLLLAGLDLMAAQVQSGDAASANATTEQFLAQADKLLEHSPPQAPRAQDSEQPRASQPQRPVATGLSGADAGWLRVAPERVDQLIELAADLVLGQQRANHALRAVLSLAEGWRRDTEAFSARLDTSHDPTWGREISERLAAQQSLCGELCATLARSHAGMEEAEFQMREVEGRARELRMLRLSSLFERYPRLLRDLSAPDRKSVKLTTLGGDVEVDRQVLDRVDEALMHLLRNAVDHGIETPDRRTAAGKPPVGTISLHAVQRESFVHITVRDDGAGLDLPRIREAALASGWLAADRLEAASNDELVGMLFKPGMTTKGKVSDVSGRGIGLDVVKERIEALGGAIDVESERGRGVAFVLRVPVLASRSRIMVVVIGRVRVALRSGLCWMTAEVSPQDLEPAGGGLFWRHGAERIPIADLRAVMGESPGPLADPSRARLLVVEHLKRRMAWIVDAFVGERTVTERALDPFLRGARLVASTTVLESGEPVLILNAAALMERAGQAASAPTSAAPSRDSSRLVLVVDDSEITRELIVAGIRRMGHRVMEGVDGRDAWERIRQRRPDLIVTDLEMPGLDGFGLLEKVRASPELRRVPVVVVSSKGAEADRLRASQLGADAYINKRQYHEATLNEVVTRMLGAGQGAGGA